jgi:hypothetical protein
MKRSAISIWLHSPNGNTVIERKEADVIREILRHIFKAPRLRRLPKN